MCSAAAVNFVRFPFLEELLSSGGLRAVFSRHQLAPRHASCSNEINGPTTLAFLTPKDRIACNLPSRDFQGRLWLSYLMSGLPARFLLVMAA